MRLPAAPPQQLKKASEQDWPPHSLLVYSSTPASIAVLVYSSTVPYHCCVQNTYIIMGIDLWLILQVGLHLKS